MTNVVHRIFQFKNQLAQIIQIIQKIAEKTVQIHQQQIDDEQKLAKLNT